MTLINQLGTGEDFSTYNTVITSYCITMHSLWSGHLFLPVRWRSGRKVKRKDMRTYSTYVFSTHLKIWQSLIRAFYFIKNTVLFDKHIMIFIIIINTYTLLLSQGLMVISCLPTTEALLVASSILMSLVLMLFSTDVLLKTELKYLFNIFAILLLS